MVIGECWFPYDARTGTYGPRRAGRYPLGRLAESTTYPKEVGIPFLFVPRDVLLPPTTIPAYTPGNPDGTYDPVTRPSGLTMSGRITSVPAISATVGVPYSYTITVVDAPVGSSLTVLIPAGSWLSYDSINTISGTPSETGTVSVFISVYDSNSLVVDSQAFTITVSEAGTFKFVSAPVTSATIGSLYSYSVVVTDGTVVDTVIPSWATYSGGVLSGIPTTTGTYPVQLDLYDGTTLKDTQAFDIKVEEFLVLKSPNNMTSNSGPAPFSILSGSFGADSYKMFDGNQTELVTSIGGISNGIVSLDFGSSVVCTRFRIKTHAGDGCPGDYLIMRGMTTVATGTLSNITGWQTIDFSNTIGDRLYSFEWTTPRFEAWTIYEMEWWGPPT